MFDLPIPEGHTKEELANKLTVTSYRKQGFNVTDNGEDSEEKVFDLSDDEIERIQPYL